MRSVMGTMGSINTLSLTQFAVPVRPPLPNLCRSQMRLLGYFELLFQLLLGLPVGA